MGKKIDEIIKKYSAEGPSAWRKTAEELEQIMEEQGAVIGELKRGIRALEIQAESYMTEVERLKKENRALLHVLQAVDELNTRLAAELQELKRRKSNGEEA